MQMLEPKLSENHNQGISDEALWELMLAGDRNAFASIYDKYFNKLYNYGFKFSGNSEVIEDCIQGLFVDIWNSRANLCKTPSVNNYLYKSFRRRVIKEATKLKAKDLQCYVIENYEFNFELSAEHHLILNQELHTQRVYLQKVINGLSTQQREVVFLYFFEKLSHSEIADQMGLKIRTVYNLLHKALINLRSDGVLKAMITHGLFIFSCLIDFL